MGRNPKIFAEWLGTEGAGDGSVEKGTQHKNRGRAVQLKYAVLLYAANEPSLQLTSVLFKATMGISVDKNANMAQAWFYAKLLLGAICETVLKREFFSPEWDSAVCSVFGAKSVE